MIIKPGELMVAVAAREIKNTDVVFVGMRLPLLAFFLAKATHAPDAVGLFENGLIRDEPASGFIVTMCDPPNITGALACTSLRDVMGYLQQGRVSLGFIGGAQVDEFGNLNTTRVGQNRLPGSGGGGDIASLAGRLTIIMKHQRRRFVPKVDYITSPGFGIPDRLAHHYRSQRRRTGLHHHHLRRLPLRPPNQAGRPHPDPPGNRPGPGPQGDRVGTAGGPGPGSDPLAHPG